jgi:spore coat polysaccharide biosynthesis protein SpsF
MKILAITQARVGSTRLPKKILKTIKNKSLLEIHLERIKYSKTITKIIVATTFENDSNLILDVAKKCGVTSFQGSTEDVLARFYYAAEVDAPDYVVRVTSDCPLIDAEIVDDVVNFCIDGKYDYVSNTLKPTFPDGMDIEIFNYTSLKKAFLEATLLSDREHVTPYIWRNSSFNGKEKFVSENFINDVDYSRFRLTVDNIEDFTLIEKLINEKGINCSCNEYVNYLIQNPQLFEINGKEERNMGYIKSLNNDKTI